MNELLKALGPKTALVMSFDNDGLTNWGECTVVPLKGEQCAEAPPESQERLSDWRTSQLDLAV